MAARFPGRRPDGSFDLLLQFRFDVDAGVLNDWLKRWTVENSTWRHEWVGRRIRVEIWDWNDDFLSGLSWEFRDGNSVAFRVSVRPESKRWKDWGVKLVRELREAGIATFEKMTSDPPGSRA